MTLLIDQLDIVIKFFETFGHVQVYPKNDERLFLTFFRGSVVIALREGPFMTISCRDESTMKHIKELLQMVMAPEPELSEGVHDN
jgi:hypothetical protein